VMGASNFTYSEATATQGLADWISAHLRAFFGAHQKFPTSARLN